MNLSRFLIFALLFFFLGIVALHTGINRAPFKKAPAEQQHQPGHTSQLQEDSANKIILYHYLA